MVKILLLMMISWRHSKRTKYIRRIRHIVSAVRSSTCFLSQRKISLKRAPSVTVPHWELFLLNVFQMNIYGQLNMMYLRADQ